MSTSAALPEFQRSTDGLVRQLTERLQTTRSRLVRIRWFAGACSVLALVLLCFALFAWADYLWELTPTVRLQGILALMVTMGVGCYGVYRLWITQLTLSRAAAEAELQVSELGQRLRTTLDYSQRSPRPADASMELLHQMHLQTIAVANRMDWKGIVSETPVFLSCLAVAFVVGCLGLGSAISTDYRLAVGRMLMFPLEYSTVAFEPTETTVRVGESAEVSITFSGRPLSSGVLRYREVGGEESEWSVVDFVAMVAADRDLANQSIASSDAPREQITGGSPADVSSSALPPLQLTGELKVPFKDLQHDIEFEVIAGPRRLPAGYIKVLQPLKLESVSGQVTPPSYVARPAEEINSLDLKVLEGSRVELTLHLSRAAATAEVTPKLLKKDESDEAVGVAIPNVRIAGSEIHIEFADVRSAANYHIAAITSDEMSLDSTTLHLRVQLDKKPEIRFLEPQEELVVTPTTEVPMVVEASDDLGLHRVGIEIQVNGGETQVIWEGSGEGSNEALRAHALLLLEEHSLTFRDAVTYYAYAEDNYFGTPRRTTTELRFIDIRPYKVDYQVVNSECECQGESVSLEELIKRQRANLTTLFPQIEQVGVDSHVIEPMRRAESELADLTQEFAEQLRQKVGPVPPLEVAILQMRQAVDALARADAQEGFHQEQEALGSLMQARENMRQKLNNSESKSTCKKVDRQFKQKLKLPQKKKDSAEQQLADARKKLEELAERERKWGQQSQSACKNPGSSSSSSSGSQPPEATAGENSQPPENNNNSASKPSSESQQGQQQQDTQQGSKDRETAGRESTQPQNPSLSELSAQQEKIRQELADLKQQLANLSQAGQSVSRQANEVDQRLQAASSQLDQKNGEAAEELAERSAEQMEELADHLGNLAMGDLGAALSEVQRLADQLARDQKQIAEELGAKPTDSEKPGSSGSNANGNNSLDAAKSAGKSGNKQLKENLEDPSLGKSSGSETGTQTTQNTNGTSSSKTVSKSDDGKLSPTDQGASKNSSSDRGDEEFNTSGVGSHYARRTHSQLERNQRSLANRTEMLGELLARLQNASTSKDSDLRRNLVDATRENSPEAIAQEMEEAARAIGAGKTVEARAAAGFARDQLIDLAKAIAAARGEFAQPQLQELLQLEEQLAQLMQQARRAGSDTREDQQSKWETLEERLSQLSQSDRKLSDALSELKNGTDPTKSGEKSSDPENPSTQSDGSKKPNTATSANGQDQRNQELSPNEFQQGGNQMPQGHFSWRELGNRQGAVKIAKALQTKIQEAILAGAIQDADQPIPPQYRPLVEKYYKTLSDDLRQ